MKSKTEMRNPATLHIDKADTATMLRLMQTENENAAKAVGQALEAIGAVVDHCYERMKRGGRLFYIGCGTSGRLGVLDASECPPTFGVDAGVVVGLIAGGDRALRYATEGTEDNSDLAAVDLKAHGLCEKDCVIGISAAGGAAYVVGGLKYAASAGAYTACITSNEHTAIAAVSKDEIVTDTGAEVITGSTRMKAGTAQKLVLNMISTSLMIKLGYVYENLMINLKPSNVKLKRRMVGIVSDISGAAEECAEAALDCSDWNIRAAVEKIKSKNA